MPIEYRPLTAERLEDVENLLLPVWNRRWDRTFADRIFRWRFLERNAWDAVVAYDGGRAVGFVDSFLRPYRTRSGVIRVREPGDWFCAPEYRPVVGITLIRILMKRREPLLVVGGNENTAELLPPLGWEELPSLASYVLPTGAGSMLKGLSETLGFPMSAVPRLVVAPLSSVPVRPRRRAPARPFPGASTRRIEEGEPIPEVAGVSGRHGLSPVLGPREQEWFRKAPAAMGRFVWLAFETAERVEGLSFSRVYEDGPVRAARLLHLEASRPSVPLYRWMIDETVRVLRRSRPQWITARFSCPGACRALEGAGFREHAPCRAFWWHDELPPPGSPLHLSWTTGDEGLLPYPS